MRGELSRRVGGKDCSLDVELLLRTRLARRGRGRKVSRHRFENTYFSREESYDHFHRYLSEFAHRPRPYVHAPEIHAASSEAVITRATQPSHAAAKYPNEQVDHSLDLTHPPTKQSSNDPQPPSSTSTSGAYTSHRLTPPSVLPSIPASMPLQRHLVGHTSTQRHHSNA